MANERTLGNSLAPWRFIAFIGVLVASAIPASLWLGSWGLGVIYSFDVAAGLFLLLCWRIVTIDDPAEMERIARLNDANRTFLLIITAIVMAVLLIAVASETVGRNPRTFAKALIITTLIVAWLFSNTVYALHYAHMAYVTPENGCAGFRFPGTPQPVYWDFVYFAFTCGMAFATSDVEVTDQRIRKVVTFHCLAAFAFNIGVLAFTVNLLASGAS
ncbi:MAG TPA: DUF1345 domain-containing protein [Sphingomicrobium sp.]|nr:DUF1345 domain-containing protein [Sphingomicrobium sp.]